MKVSVASSRLTLQVKDEGLLEALIDSGILLKIFGPMEVNDWSPCLELLEEGRSWLWFRSRLSWFSPARVKVTFV